MQRKVMKRPDLSNSAADSRLATSTSTSTLKRTRTVPVYKINPIKIKYNGPLGFQWRDSSCAVDSFYIMLIYGFKLIKRDFDGSFQDEFPHLYHAIYDLAINGNVSGWYEYRDFFLDYVRQSPYVSAFPPERIREISTLDVFTALLSRDSTGVPSESTPYIYSVAIDIPVCHRGALEFQSYAIKRIRNLDYHEFTTVENCIKSYEITTLPVRKCNMCGQNPCISFRLYESTPIMLILHLDAPVGWLNKIDEHLKFGPDDYTLVAAIYGNGNHFKTRFQYKIGGKNTYWEYDSNKGTLTEDNARQCLPLFSGNVFPVTPSASYVVDTILYIKNSCFV